MNTTERLKPISNASPRLTARIAGVLYFVSVVLGVFNEFVVHGRLGFLGTLFPVLCQVVLTLLLYAIFKPVNRSLCLLAVCSQLVGLIFEVLLWQPRGVNVAMVFHGFYCLLIGWLISRSRFLPRILGLSMVFAGVVWLTYLFPLLADRVTPYNTASGLLGEVLPMLWLLVVGLNEQRWKEQAGTAG